MTPDSTRRERIPARLVRLSDGADWGFARPTVRLVPRVVAVADLLGRPVERIEIGTGIGYPLEVERLRDRVRSACADGSASEQFEAFTALAACLLVRVHEISRASARELLAVSEDELPRLVRDVMAVVAEAEAAPETNRVEDSTVESS